MRFMPVIRIYCDWARKLFIETQALTAYIHFNWVLPTNTGDSDKHSLMTNARHFLNTPCSYWVGTIY